VASAIALLLYFCNITLPKVATETFSFLGNMTPPLSMIILGSVLAEYPLSSIFKDLKINLMLIVKQLLLPVIATVLAHLVFTDPVITGIITLTFAMPCATMTVMLSKEYKSDTLTASAGVVFTTVLSLITIPVAFVLFVI
jgi:predicted permease